MARTGGRDQQNTARAHSETNFMIFFTSRKKVEINFQSYNTTFQPPPPNKSSELLPLNRIYCCGAFEFVQIGRALALAGLRDVLQVIPEAQITSRNDFPKLLGVSNRGELERYLYVSGVVNTIDDKIITPEAANLGKQISDLRSKRIRIAIFNGLGSGIGDTIMGLTALSKVRDLIAKVAEPSFEVIYSREPYSRLAQIYQHTTLVDKVHIAPLTLKQLIDFDAIFDTGGMANRQDFEKMAAVDFFLKYFGLNPIEIPDNEKRNTLIQLAPDNELKKSIQEIRNDNPDKKLILFHPKASTELRTIPDEYIEEIVQYLGGIKKYILVAVVPLPGKDLPITNLSSQCRSFKDLCFVIGQMDGVFTVDTSIYHIADCFSIPTVVWFTSINPDLMARSYPTVKGILLDGAEQTKLRNKHFLGESDNLGDVEKLWGDLDLDKSVSELESLCAVKNT